MIADLAQTAAVDKPQITYLEYGSLFGSLTNPRTFFDPVPLDELSRSIEQRGIEMPLLGRLSKAEGREGLVETVAGERRLRATGLALERIAAAAAAAEGEEAERLQALYEERARVPVILKDLDDATVLELQLIENLQRSDLTAIEEARGYQRLLDLPGYTPRMLADKVGKNIQTILDKLKILQAPDFLLDALNQKQVSERVVMIVCGVPGKKQREEFAQLVVEGEHDWHTDSVVPVTVRQALAYRAENYCASLKTAAWDLADPELLPAAGACVTCPHFAKHAAESDPDLAEQLGNGRGKTDPLTCMNPSCHKLKLDAVWKRRVGEAKGSGVTVLNEAAAEKLGVNANGYVRENAKVVSLDERVPSDIIGHHNVAKIPTWREVLEGQEVSGRSVLKTDREVIELVDRQAAIEAAKKHPELGATFQAKAKAGKQALTDKQKREKEKAALEKKCDARLRHVFLDRLSGAAQKKGMDGDAAFLVLDIALNAAGMDGNRLLCEWLKIEPAKVKKGDSLSQGHYKAALLDHLKARDGGKPELDLFILLALLANGIKNYGWSRYSHAELGQFYGITEAELKAEAKRQVQAEADEKEAAKKAKEKPKSKSKGRDKDPAGVTVQRNADLAISEVIKQGDKQRQAAPSAKPGAVPTAEHVAWKLKKPDATIADFRAWFHLSAKKAAALWPLLTAPAEGVDYHCDCCGIVCRIAAAQVEDIEALKPGQFLCRECAVGTEEVGYEELDDQEPYEVWAGYPHEELPSGLSGGEPTGNAEDLFEKPAAPAGDEGAGAAGEDDDAE